MLRKRAIRSLLIEDVAGLHLPEPDEAEGPPADGGDHAGAEAGPTEETHALREEEQEQALRDAERKAKLVVALDWTALAVLFVLRDTGEAFLPFGPTTDTIFTLGVMAVAIHSGFRLGQLEKLRAVARMYERLR